MPRKTDLLRSQDKRNELIKRSRACIEKYMTLNEVSVSYLAKKQHVTERTILNRIKTPEKMQLEDLWEMAMLIKCPVGELAGGELPEELIGRMVAEATERRIT